MSGTLYIVATPIGNLEDITARALRVLREVDGIVAEDTRYTRQLLTHFDIHPKHLLVYFEHSKPGRIEHILNILKGGESLALVSDAGTPTLSDPGARVVARAHEEGVTVVPVPGPSALLSAVMTAGLPTEPLHFWGFLSPSRTKRKRVYRKVVDLDGLHAFYVSPHKLHAVVEEWREFFAGYEMFVAREITKKFEEFIRGDFDKVSAILLGQEPRGEYTVLVCKEKL